MLNGESYLNIKSGVKLSRRGDFLIETDSTSGIKKGFYKRRKKPSDLKSATRITQRTSNDADYLAMYSHIFDQVSGNVLLIGLGVGAVAALIADIDDVERLTICEQNLGAINLYIEGNYPNSNKINMINGNPYHITGNYDYIIYDIGLQPRNKKLKVTANNYILYPDWQGYNSEKGGDIYVLDRPWPRMFELDDPRLISVKTRIETLNKKIL